MMIFTPSAALITTGEDQNELTSVGPGASRGGSGRIDDALFFKRTLVVVSCELLVLRNRLLIQTRARRGPRSAPVAAAVLASSPRRFFSFFFSGAAGSTRSKPPPGVNIGPDPMWGIHLRVRIYPAGVRIVERVRLMRNDEERL